MRELILTGIKELWPADETRAIFLGPWCFANNHKYKFWDQDRFTLAPSPWQTPEDVLNASLYIDSFIDRIMSSFSRFMNSFHKVDYSERFWKIYSIVWLVHWLGICYDRYQRLNHLQQITDERLTVKILNKRKCCVKDYSDYMKKITEGHYYNLLLMSDIIRNGQFNFLISEVLDISENNFYKKNDIQGSAKGHYFKTDLSRELKRLAKTASKTFENRLTSSIYLGIIYGISIIDRCYLQFSYDPLAIFKRKNNSKLLSVEGDGSNFIKQPFDFDAKNEFEEIVKNIILQYVPETFLALHPPPEVFNSKIMVWIGNDIYHSEKYAYRIAKICEGGGQWISAQHGGGYGQTFSFPLSKIEYETSDGFITWGWDFNHVYFSRLYPLPSPLLSKLGKHGQKNNMLIFVSTVHPPYLYRLHSTILPEQQLEYMRNKLVFIRGLSTNIRSKIKYRPYFFDYGIEEKEFISRTIPPEQFMLEGILINEFQKCKLIVVDHLATSFLEACAMNAPTILFWNPAHFVVIPDVAPYFDKLRSAGILFDNPQDAANKVNEIWNNVQEWWQQPEIQSARNEFCYQFARTSKNWRKEWRDFLKTLK